MTKLIKYIPIFALVLVAALNSCSEEEFLNYPYQEGTESDVQFRTTMEGISYTLNAAYAFMGGDFWSQYPLNKYLLGNYKSDDVQAGGGGLSDGVNEYAINEFNIFSKNSVIWEFWRGCYNGIHYANMVIVSGQSPDHQHTPDEQALLNRYIGEALCLRAYYYFDLVREFGDVPLVINEDNSLRGRESSLVVYQQIERDLLEAEGLMNIRADELPAADKGRMSSGAARALLAKVYLFWASMEPAKANEYFQKSYNAAKDVITSGQFTLLPSYGAIWDETGNFSSESIIESGQPDKDVVNVNISSGFTRAYSPRYMFTTNSFGVIKEEGAFGWGKMTPTQDFVNAFENGDPRLYYSVYAEGDSCNVNAQNIYKRVSFSYSNTGYYYKKYDPLALSASEGSGLNVKYFRYADLVLVGAEAANEVGQTADALTWLELIRNRARNTPAAKDRAADKIAGVPLQITETNKLALRDIIRNERRVELGIEAHRFYDLVRWDGVDGFNWAETIKAAQLVTGPNYMTISADKKSLVLSDIQRLPVNITSIDRQKHKVGPIPYNDIVLSNGTLVQTPGY